MADRPRRARAQVLDPFTFGVQGWPGLYVRDAARVTFEQVGGWSQAISASVEVDPDGNEGEGVVRVTIYRHDEGEPSDLAIEAVALLEDPEMEDAWTVSLGYVTEQRIVKIVSGDDQHDERTRLLSVALVALPAEEGKR